MHGDGKGRGGGLFDKSLVAAQRVAGRCEGAKSVGRQRFGGFGRGEERWKTAEVLCWQPRRTVRGALAANSCWARAGWALAGAFASGCAGEGAPRAPSAQSGRGFQARYITASMCCQ